MSNIKFLPQPYPLGAFPSLLMTTALEVEQYIQAPQALIAASIIAALSTACQGSMDVIDPTGRKRPSSLNVLVIAESGERKSTVDGLIFAPIYTHDQKSAETYQVALDAYHAERELWDAANQGLRRRVGKAVSMGRSTDAIQEELAQHLMRKPKKPRFRRVIRQDMTARALMEALEGDGESIALTSDEGHVLLKSEVMTHLGLLNKAWDGAQVLSLDRAEFDHVLVSNPRVTMNIVTQHAALYDYLRKHRDIARGSGHWARYLVAWPLSTQGGRVASPTEPNWVSLPVFQDRLKQLIEQSTVRVESGKAEREILEFSDDAKMRWFELARHTETLLRPGDYLHDVKDFASKVMEHLSRLAALFHYFNGDTGKISSETLERAYNVLRWHVEEFKRIFAAPPLHEADAVRLFKYLRDCVWEGPGSDTYVDKNDVRQRGPLRDRDRLNAALRLLADSQAIWILQDAKNKKWLLRLNNYHFTVV